MDHQDITNRLHAVINTLCAATLRADQLDAVQRIAACCNELRGVIKALETTTDDQKEG